MPDLHARRRSALTDRLRSLEADAALVTNILNVRYLTGFTGSNGALLLIHQRAVLITDGRYETQAAEQAADVELIIDRSLSSAALTRAHSLGARRLGFEDHHVTVSEHARLGSNDHDVTLVRLGLLVEQLRAVKDTAEIDALRTACAITSTAYDEMLQEVRAGMTERDVAWALESRMRALGAEGPAFETIVASGPNSAIPHHRADERQLASGDFVTCDFGARSDGYHADMTRTFAIGTVSDWQREVYALVARAQVHGREAVVAGVDCRRVDDAARSVVNDSGHAGRFVHGLGHGVGLEIHEAPWLGPTATGSLAAGNVVTVEPGVYLPGRGGVRIEDTVVVSAEGNEALTQSTRELVAI